MIRLFVLICSFLAITPATAKDLPQGDFLHTGPVLPGIQEGYIVPVVVHVSIKDNQMHWSLMTTFAGDVLNCEEWGKCDRLNQTLTHHVTMAEDGTLSLDKVDRKTSENLAVDRQPADDRYIFGALNALIDGAKLTIDDQGGTLLASPGRRGTPRQITLHPKSLDETQQALAFVLTFEVSTVRLNHCAIRQYADIVANPTRGALDDSILAVGRLRQKMMLLQDVAYYYSSGEVPENKRAETKLAADKSLALNYLRSYGYLALEELQNSSQTPVTDAQLWEQVTELLPGPGATGAGRINSEYGELIATTMREELIATIRHAARVRVRAAHSAGHDMLVAICQDIRLPLNR